MSSEFLGSAFWGVVALLDDGTFLDAFGWLRDAFDSPPVFSFDSCFNARFLILFLWHFCEFLVEGASLENPNCLIGYCGDDEI